MIVLTVFRSVVMTHTCVGELFTVLKVLFVCFGDLVNNGYYITKVLNFFFFVTFEHKEHKTLFRQEIPKGWVTTKSITIKFERQVMSRNTVSLFRL